MSKRQIIILLGIFVILIPFLGLPSSWDTLLNIVSGLIIIIVVFNIYPKDKIDGQLGKKREEDIKKDDSFPFVDHRNSGDVNNISP